MNSGRGIQIRNIELAYGKGKKAKLALNSINLSVDEGSIYGLLGPSGCGKTTLLRCIIGQIKPSRGSISVFGSEPDSDEHNQYSIGYMPQDYCLYEDFTIKETLVYFGCLYALEKGFLKKRIDFLINFLNLPNKNRVVKNLSGGQKRRVSLSAALIHNPSLLILDEPTVGVDPILRFSIWEHLVNLAKSENVTVVITTHYIEEAQKATRVGLMRSGQILAEDNPEHLLRMYGKETLEDVFLEICVSGAVKENDMTNQETLDVVDVNPVKSASKPDEPVNGIKYHKREESVKFAGTRDVENARAEIGKNTYWSVLMVLLWRNFIKIRRNIFILLVQLALPSTQIILYYYCVGPDPFNIPLAIVNLEDPPFLSGKLLEKFDPHVIRQVHFDSFEEAIEVTKKGDVWGVMHIPQYFSLNLQKRIIFGDQVDDRTVNESMVRFYPDLTNQQISYTMEKEFKRAFKIFSNETLFILGRSPELAGFPLELGKPVYGDLEKNGFSEFLMPGLMICLTSVMATGLTALTFILERKEGLYERSLISGVKHSQIFLSHSLTQAWIMVIQASLVMAVVFCALDVPIRGAFGWAVLLVILQGFAGMAFGFLISSVCYEENTAVMIIVGTFYPNLILSAIMWPIEAMPKMVRWFSRIQPQTLAAEALRHILSRGWTIDQFDVYIGFFSTILWTSIFVIMTLVLFRKNH